MRNLLFIVAAALVSGCTSSAPPPSCEQAVDHYYAASCDFADPNTGAVIPMLQFVGECETIAEGTPSACIGDLNAFLECIDSVPSPAKSSADCDCTQSYMTLADCH